MYSTKRHIEPIVARRAKNAKAILLTGPRQVGKSTLFTHLFSDVNRVTFDDDLLLAQASEDVGLFLLNNPPPLMIDEVQKCPAIFNKPKIILDNTDQRSIFFLTGSQKLQLMENISESLAGRVSIMEMDTAKPHRYAVVQKSSGLTGSVTKHVPRWHIVFAAVSI